MKKYKDKYKQVTLYLSHEEAVILEQLRLEASERIGLDLTINQLIKMMINKTNKVE